MELQLELFAPEEEQLELFESLAHPDDTAEQDEISRFLPNS